MDINMPKQEQIDKFNRGVFGEWHFEDLWNTRHGDSPGMEKYWENQRPEYVDPTRESREGIEKEFKKSKKTETDKAKRDVL